MPRVDGGPEALLRLDERRRLLGRPPLGPALLTADAAARGLPVPVVTVTDTPVARETDYGRVDDHSSAIRAAGDTRHTFNRVPDYPSPGADTVYGAWTGGRLTASSSSSDSTALPDVATAASPAAAIDGDSATAWVSNSLQSAVGQWLQVDFDHPVTNAHHHHHPQRDRRRRAGPTHRGRNRHRHNARCGSTRPANRSAGRCRTARRRGSASPRSAPTTGRRGCSSRSPTCRSRSTTLAASRIRSTFGTPSLVPAPPPDAAVAQWDLGSDPLGRPGCATGLTNVQCAPSMALATETPATFSRTLSVPQPMSVPPTIWVRARSGTQAGRSGRRAGHHPGARRLRSGRRARRGLRRHRRRPGHRVDGTAASGAAQDAPDAHPHPASAHRSDRAAGHAQHVAGARAPDAWWPSTWATARRSGRSKTIGAARPAADAPGDRHHHGQPARLERRHRPHRTGLRPTQAAGAGRDRGAGHRRQHRSPPPTPRATGLARSPSTASTARSSRSPAGSCTLRSPPPSARCWTALR